MLTTDKLKTIKRDRESAIVITEKTVYKYVEDLANGMNHLPLLIEMGFGQQIIEGLVSQPALLLQQSTDLAKHADTPTIRSYLSAAKKAMRYGAGIPIFSIDDLLILWKRPPLRWSIYEVLKGWTDKERAELIERLQSYPANGEFLNYYLELYPNEDEEEGIKPEPPSLEEDENSNRKILAQFAELHSRINTRLPGEPLDLTGVFADDFIKRKPPVKLDQVSEKSPIKRFKPKDIGITNLYFVETIKHPKGDIELAKGIFTDEQGTIYSFSEDSLPVCSSPPADSPIHIKLSKDIDYYFFEDRDDMTSERCQELRMRWLSHFGWKKKRTPSVKEYRKFVSGLMKPNKPAPEVPQEYLIPDDIFESNSETTEQITEQESIL